MSGLHGSSPAVDATARPLELARRLDWRFLLPASELGAVGVSHGPDPELENALRLFSSSVTSLRESDTPAAGKSPEYDLIVLVDPRVEEIRAAARALKAEGWLHVQVSSRRLRPLRRPRVVGAYVRALRSTGLEDVAAYWHIPDFVSCEEIVPLAGAGALTFSFRRHPTTLRVRLKDRLATRLARLRLLSWAVPHGSVLGRKSRAA